MRYNKPFAVCWTLVLCLMLAGAQSNCTDDNDNDEADIDSEQKISDTAGSFDGDLDPGDQFGSAIANIDDLEGDGVVDLAVGTPFDDDNGLDRGAVWILFMDDDGRVDEEQKISDEKGDFEGDLDNGDRFGSAVAGIGDLNGDGTFDLAVGAPLDDDDGTNRGAVWILFLNDDGKVRSIQKISAEEGGFGGDLDNDDQFGGAVASIGDLNGDGVTDLAVGAQNDDDAGTDKGAVWILFMNTNGTVRSVQKISQDEGDFNGNLNNGDRFGSAVAGIGDLDGDGIDDLAVGANQDDDGGLDRGAVWILFLNSDGTVRSEQKISQREGDFDGDLANGDRFGSALADIGDVDGNGVNDLAVGADQDDDGGLDRGAVWLLFLKDNGEVSSEDKISSTEGNFDGALRDGDRFGSAVADMGNLDGEEETDIAVGARLDDDGGNDQGAVWILFTELTN